MNSISHAAGLLALVLAGCVEYEIQECEPASMILAWTDEDGDGFGAGESVEVCALSEGQVDRGLDCDDADPAVHPEAEEECNGVDDDCDGQRDQGFDLVTFYADEDGDGFGVLFPALLACDRPGDEWVRNADDCDDTNADIHPNGIEVCNAGIDDDCDGLADDLDEDVLNESKSRFYADTDADGFGHPVSSILRCVPSAGWVEDNTDCDDANGDRNPAATEVCNHIDDDCDTLTDDADPSIDPTTQSDQYPDTDGDGFGDGSSSVLACWPVPGVSVDNADDCDDTNATIHPDATDTCNGGIDDDCDAATDENDVSGPGWYIDTDGDGYGETYTEIRSCSPIPGRVSQGGDCDEQNPAFNPGAHDICEDGIDQDCDGADDLCRQEFEMGTDRDSSWLQTRYLRGAIFRATTADTLIDFSWYLGLGSACDLDFYVWEGPTSTGPWVQVYGATVRHGPGVDFWQSPTVDVDLTANTYYAIGTAWNCTATYYGDYRGWAGNYPIGTYIGTVWDNGYPGYSPNYTPPNTSIGTGLAYYSRFGYAP